MNEAEARAELERRFFDDGHPFPFSAAAFTAATFGSSLAALEALDAPLVSGSNAWVGTDTRASRTGSSSERATKNETDGSRPGGGINR